MAVRGTIILCLAALALVGAAGCGRMIVVGEVDAGDGADGDTDTDVDSDTDADTDPSACTWHTHQVDDSLNGVWGLSADVVYAVGGNLWTNAVALRYDGSAWTELGGIGGVYPGLSDVWGAAEDDVWAIAFGLQVLRFDGLSWEFTDIVDEPLLGIWGSSPTDVFVVGGGLWQDALIMHYNGDGWLPMSGATGGWLTAVWGSSATDVFAVGEKAVNHYNGNLWSPMNMGSISLEDVILEDVWGSSSGDVYAVGHHWAGPVLLQYDGLQWAGINVGSIASGAELYGVHGIAPDDVWVVGAQQFGGIVLHFDGEDWAEVSYPFPFQLYDVWVAPTGEVFTVGELGVVYCTL